ncbi:BtrH N-terminal domain-containing protein [Acetivibrio cellulolyticus]|uniref:BtrH N-terminal domain-containing protein n=1 Tax=Acetivibrio cellulolyticus TaxID=35830 RepID=UPI0001E2E716|nr:BtrH N-terminal domain-containing protein [Acetivibrio cellulolyticus]
MLNIKPININGNNCIDSFLFSYAISLQREAPMVFSEDIGFLYSPADPEHPEVLGNRISTGLKLKFPLFEKYCGIKSDMHPPSSYEDILRVIKENLEQQRPVAVYIDAFWCPWHKFYNKVHDDHFCLVIGIDSESNLTCIDPGLYIENTCTLPFDFFKNGFGYYMTFQVSTITEKLDYTSVLKASLERAITSKSTENIRQFAEDIKFKLNMTEEFKDFKAKSSWSVDLLKNLEQISGARENYAKFLGYISEKCKEPRLSNFSADLLELQTKWQMVKVQLTKCYFMKSIEASIQSIYNLLYDISHIEEELINALYAVAASRYKEPEKSIRSKINIIRSINQTRRKAFIFCDKLYCFFVNIIRKRFSNSD